MPVTNPENVNLSTSETDRESYARLVRASAAGDREAMERLLMRAQEVAYAQKMAAVTAYESVFSGDQASLIDKYSAEDRYVGSLVGVQYAEAFKARSPLLVDSPDVFATSRFG